MSPQPRRGRPAQSNQHKSPTRGSADAHRPSNSNSAAATPAASATPAVPAVPAKAPAVPAVPAKAPAKAATTPGRGHEGSMGLARKGRPSGLRRNSAPRIIGSYLKAYIPLFIGFLVIFGGLWAWVSWGPHASTARERWTQIENKYMPPRDAAAQKVAASSLDFKAQLDGYRDYRDQTKAWMQAVAEVSDWSDPSVSVATNAETNAAVQAMISAGNAQVAVLDKVVAAKTPQDVLAIGQDVITTQQTFATEWAIAKSDIFPPVAGSSPSPGASQPTLALPSGSLSPTASPVDTSSQPATASPTAAATLIASASPKAS